MKKQYAQIIILAILLLSLVGSIMRCQQRGDAPSKEIIEAPDSIEIADSTEIVDSALQVQTARRYFEALTKIADGGKVYATDADGKRISKAFTRYDDYKQFIAANPQYPKNYYSYDSGGTSFNINLKTSPNGDGMQIQNKPQPAEPIP